MPAGDMNRGTDRFAAVVCHDLVVRYGDRTAVDRVSFTAERGEVLCILGPNGAGKTSTVECLEGYRRPVSGSALVLGLDPWKEHRVLVHRIGVMLQRGGVYPMLGPRRALSLFASYYEHPEDPDALLDLLRLREVATTPWRHLSGGEQARLSLALALVGRPEVVFLDEPTAGVDPEGRLAVRDVVAGLRERAVSVVLTTHELAEAERLADQIVILHRGSVVAEGPPASLASHAVEPAGSAGTGEEIVFGAAPDLDVAALGSAVGAVVVEESPGRYRVTPPSEVSATAVSAAVGAWLAEKGLALRDLRIGQSLEEAYLTIVGTSEAESSTFAQHRGRRSRGWRAPGLRSRWGPRRRGTRAGRS